MVHSWHDYRPRHKMTILYQNILWRIGPTTLNVLKSFWIWLFPTSMKVVWDLYTSHILMKYWNSIFLNMLFSTFSTWAFLKLPSFISSSSLWEMLKTKLKIFKSGEVQRSEKMSARIRGHYSNFVLSLPGSTGYTLNLVIFYGIN